MKLLYDHQIFSTQVYGGISRYFYELITRIAIKENVKLGLYLGYNINKYGMEKVKSNCAEYYGYNYKHIPKTGRVVSLLNKIKLNGFGKKFNPDIYHPTYYQQHLTNIRAKRVITVYDMIHEKLPEHFNANDKMIQVKKTAIKSADAIIAISESSKRDLIEILNIPEEKIKVIYLANSLSNNEDIITKIDYPYILYVGARGGYKNVELLLRTYAQAEQIKNNFKIILFGGGNLTKDEVEYLKKLKIDNNVVQMAGSDDLLADLYRQAAVFIYPSLYEGFGIPPLEAMHFGCPVIASNTSSIPEVVGNAGMLFDPTSEEDLLNNLYKVLSDEVRRDDLINKGHYREDQFTWDKCVDETLDFYNSLMDK